MCKERMPVKMLLDACHPAFGVEAINVDELPNIAALAATANKCLHGVPGHLIRDRSQGSNVCRTGCSLRAVSIWTCASYYRGQHGEGFLAVHPVSAGWHLPCVKHSKSWKMKEAGRQRRVLFIGRRAASRYAKSLTENELGLDNDYCRRNEYSSRTDGHSMLPARIIVPTGTSTQSSKPSRLRGLCGAGRASVTGNIPALPTWVIYGAGRPRPAARSAPRSCCCRTVVSREARRRPSFSLPAWVLACSPKLHADMPKGLSGAARIARLSKNQSSRLQKMPASTIL